MQFPAVEQIAYPPRQIVSPIYRNGHQPPQSQHHTRRTLMEGIGGWGGWMVKECKRLMQDEPGSEYIRYQEIDVDGGDAEAYAPGEFIFVGDVPVHDVLTKLLKEPESYSHLLSRIGSLDKLYQAFRSSDNLGDGARRYRPAGLLGLSVSLEQQGPQIESLMMQPVYELLQHEPQGCGLGHTSQTPVRVSLAGRSAWSLVGGVGSGDHLTKTYLRWHQLRQRGIRPVEMDAVAALPGMFKNVEDQTFILANCYASLLELMRPYQQPLPPVSFAPFGQVKRDFPPYMLIYLVNGGNTGNLQFSGPETGARLGAEFWRMTTYGPMAQAYTMMVKNILPQLASPYIASSFGVAGLHLPAEDLITQFGYPLGAQVLSTYFLASLDREAKEHNGQHLQTFLNHTGLVNLGVVFAKDEAGEDISISLKQFEHYSRPALPAALALYQKEQLGRWEKTLVKLATATVPRLVAALDQQLTRLLNTQSGGLAQAAAFLGVEEGKAVGALSQVLEQRRSNLNRQLEHARAESDQVQTQTVKQARLPFYRRLTFTPRKTYLKRKQAEMELELQRIKLEAELAVVDEILKHVMAQAQQVDSWQVTLSTLVDRLLGKQRQFAQERVAHQTPTITNVLCPEQEAELYQQHVADALKLARQGLAFACHGHEFILRYHTAQTTSTPRLAVLSEEGIDQHLQFAKQFWQHLRELSVERILADRGKNPTEIAALLQHEAAPLISINQVKQHQAVITQMLLGSEHGAKGFFAKFTPQTGLSMVTTGNRHRLDFLYTIHGIHPLALAEIEAMHHAYTTLRARGEYVHVCPESELYQEEEEKTYAAE